jgi:hypothetical protein
MYFCLVKEKACGEFFQITNSYKVWIWETEELMISASDRNSLIHYKLLSVMVQYSRNKGRQINSNPTPPALLGQLLNFHHTLGRLRIDQ